MRNPLFIFAFLLLGACMTAQAREVTDTLMSTKNDRVIITYDLKQENGRIQIQFRDANKKLGRTFKDKYKKLDEVTVFFFDRVESFDDIKFSGIETQAFMTPSGVKYRRSTDGYFLINDNPSLTFELSSAEPQTLSIPMFLAHYEGKHRYKVFSRCEDLVVNLKNKAGTRGGSQQQTINQTITSQEEVEGSFTDADEAGILINKVSDLLEEQEEYPFTDELKQAISSLRDRSYRITDARLSSRISEVLAACKVKEEQLKQEAQASAAATAKEAEQKAQAAAAQAQARQDSIAAVAQQKAEEDKKRNMWLMIGGAALALLAFLGSQVAQHMRNTKNQKSMMDMQNAAVRKAEEEAKRRSRSYAQSQARQAEYNMKKKARDMADKGMDGMFRGKGKNKKDVSI